MRILINTIDGKVYINIRMCLESSWSSSSTIMVFTLIGIQQVQRKQSGYIGGFFPC